MQSDLQTVVIAQDFIQYCEGIDSLRMDRVSLYSQRSAASLAPAALLSQYVGIMDGLIATNTIALWAILVGFQHLAKRAGHPFWVAFLLILPFPPLLLSGRMLDSARLCP